MKQKLRSFDIHQTATSLQRTYNLNPTTIWYPALNESNQMKSTYFTIHPGKNPPPQNGCRLKSVFIHLFIFKSTDFTSSTFPIQPNFPQNHPAAITLNTRSPRTLVCPPFTHEGRVGMDEYVGGDGWSWWRRREEGSRVGDGVSSLFRLGVYAGEVCLTN